MNYFDRINLSVAGPQLQYDFGPNAVQLGWLFSAFFWIQPVLPAPPPGQLHSAQAPKMTIFSSRLMRSINTSRRSRQPAPRVNQTLVFGNTTA